MLTMKSMWTVSTVHEHTFIRWERKWVKNWVFFLATHNKNDRNNNNELEADEDKNSGNYTASIHPVNSRRMAFIDTVNIGVSLMTSNTLCLPQQARAFTRFSTPSTSIFHTELFWFSTQNPSRFSTRSSSVRFASGSPSSPIGFPKWNICEWENAPSTSWCRYRCLFCDQE